MTSRKLAAFAFAVVLVQGCTAWNYEERDQQVVFKITSWNHDPIEKTVNNADASSFKELAHGYAVDKKRAYYKGEFIFNSDPSSFQVIDKAYAKDKNSVYMGEHKIPEANPGSFVILGDGWAKDEKRIFNYHEVVSAADVSSFGLLKYPWAIDANNAYYGSSYRDVIVFKGIDPKTFKIITPFEATDKNGRYSPYK